LGWRFRRNTFCRRGEVLDRIAEELVAILERGPLRDDVQEVELVDAHREAERDDLVDVRHVLLVDADVDVHDDASVAAGADHTLHQPVEGALDARQAIVQLGRVAVQAERDLAETGLDGRQVEVALREHVAVGDRLHPVVANLPGIADEVDELWMRSSLRRPTGSPCRRSAPRARAGGS
jgi:hypothetical protein